MKRMICLAGVASAAFAAPAMAQDAGQPGVTAKAPDETVFDGDYLTVGVGVGMGSSYSGSDDYVLFALPIVQGSLGGIGISPRPAGLALDFVPDDDGAATTFAAGPLIRLNRDRVDAEDIDDEVVAAYGELDTAVEVGASVGVGIPRLLNPFDSLSFTLDAGWDVAGAHSGMSASPSVTYFTPLSRGIAASLSVSANYMDDDFADYYYSVPASTPGLAAGDLLPAFQADGGFESVGVNMLLGFDLNGDVTDGGLALVALGGYSRLLGDAADSPFTSIRGDADQFLIAGGLAYTF